MMVESSEYPVRPGIKDCQFYLRTGRCGYGENCCYNHPKETPRGKINMPKCKYAFNLFSLNAPVTENGYNEEEMKLVKETRKIWNDTEVKVTATCIRVPVMRAHAESVNLQFDNPLDELLFLVIPPPKPLFVFVPSG
ncbi:unnamed protein product [Brassica rapa]|uniref:C3H1-type domain-containing protein n=2 Tax=Brassica TaxID=3705 RepID=A0A8D9G024_BRACM|nr:unnamed protein product [Brassica napus]CAG7864345.1 unnamed protein product [Brassica rapa]